MEILKSAIFENETYSVETESGLKMVLTNASQFADEAIRYKWNNPAHGCKTDVFGLVGDGEFDAKVYYLLTRQDDGSRFITTKSDFQDLFHSYKI